ncbi:MAG: hypothetical protein AB4368_03275 [Xenococcaceae cyanobacterium]
MSVFPIEQATTENSFSEEAIDLLLLLEQELPKYIQDSNLDAAKILINTANTLKTKAEWLKLDAIYQVANSLFEMLNNCLDHEVVIDNIVTQYLTDVLESLQVLLMGSLIGSSVEEQTILVQVKNIIIEFNQYVKNNRQDNNFDSVNNQISNIETKIPATDNRETEASEPEDSDIISEAINLDLPQAQHLNDEINTIATTDNREIDCSDTEDSDIIDSNLDLKVVEHQPINNDLNINQVENITLEENSSDIIPIIDNSITDELEEHKPLTGNFEVFSITEKASDPKNLNNSFSSTIIPNDSIEVVEQYFLENNNTQIPELGENDLSIRRILDTPAKNTIFQVDYKLLKRLNNLLDHLTFNNRLQATTDIDRQKSITKISQQINKIQPLLDEIKNWSKQLTKSKDNPEITNSSYADLLNNSIDSILKETSVLTSNVESLKVNNRKSDSVNCEQRKLLSSSTHILDRVNNISFRDILKPLQNIWLQLQKLHHKVVLLELISPNVTIDKKLGEKVYKILLYCCCYLLEESIESKASEYNLDKEVPEKITIETYKQNNNLIINISNCSKCVILHPTTILENSLNSQVTTQNLTTELREFFLDSKIFSNPEHLLSKLSAMVAREIHQQLKDLQGTLNINSNPQKGTNITIKIALEKTTEKLIFFEANSSIYAFQLSSIKQIILPQMGKVEETKKEKNLIISNTEKTKIPILKINQIVSNFSDLLQKSQSCKPENKNINSTEYTYIILGNYNQNYALEINRFLGKETVPIEPLESCLDLPSYIVGTTTYGDNESVLVLNGSLIKAVSCFFFDSKQRKR